MKKIRPIAIHLPQFHPIEENDNWWGKGFTEWRNVAQGKPRFSGHYQPHIPADLGYYDMRLPEIRQQQAELATKYGIYGFCYYHYWFDGKLILERPVKEILQSGEPDFPFMLCWANENWTRVWDGGDNDMLLEQTYTEADYYAHAEYLMPYFKDERYIKVDGKPVFIIYKDGLIPNINRLIEIFREVANKNGIVLYLCRFERGIGTNSGAPKQYGFDAGIEFQPLSLSFSRFNQSNNAVTPSNVIQKGIKFIAKKISAFGLFKKWILKNGLIDNKFSYPKFVEYDINHQDNQYFTFPGVSPGFDNTSRRVDYPATIFTDANPNTFGKWVKEKLKQFSPPSPEENFLFINAWNEWAEGNHLEPCLKYGHQYLEALRNALDNKSIKK